MSSLHSPLPPFEAIVNEPTSTRYSSPAEQPEKLLKVVYDNRAKYGWTRQYFRAKNGRIYCESFSYMGANPIYEVSEIPE